MKNNNSPMTSTSLPAVLSTLAALTLSGCASPDTARLIARTQTTAFYSVTVNFDADNCPHDVTPPSTTCSVGTGFCPQRGRSVQWFSNPAGIPFEVYFDPFVGRPYASHGTDEKTSPVVIRRDTLPGEYKYSILGLHCRGPNAVLDPPLRVEE